MLVFLLSLFSTVAIFGGGMLYFFSGLFGIEPIKNTNETTPRDTLPRVGYLLCVPDYELCYELYIDFHRVEASVSRLYIDASHFEKGGLSGILQEAKSLGFQYDGALAVTDTQLAAIIDYVGGVSCDVDKRISAICGGITLGYGNISGVAAIKLYEAEAGNEMLCLTMTEELLNKWCLILSNKRSFFRLLDLSVNNLSYADYLPIAEYFEKFKE